MASWLVKHTYLAPLGGRDAFLGVEIGAEMLILFLFTLLFKKPMQTSGYRLIKKSIFGILKVQGMIYGVLKMFPHKLSMSFSVPVVE